MKETIRIGIVGAGSIVRDRHMAGIASVPGAKVVVVCNQRFETAKRFCADYGIKEIEPRWQDVVKRPDLDVIWIGAPPYLHAPVALAALENGKHVFCQARMAMNLAEAREMLAAAKKRPRQVAMLCPAPHGMVGGDVFAGMLKEGAVGETWHLRLTALSGMFADPKAPAHWRQRVEISGDNVLSVGIYAEVLNRWFGVPARLRAQTAVLVPKRGGYRVKVPDLVQVLAEWPRGLLGNLEWSGVAPFGGDEKLEVSGSEGILVYNFTRDEILWARRGEAGPRPVPVPAAKRGSWRVEQDFLGTVRAGTGKPEPSFATGVKYMEWLEAIHRSAREGRVIDWAKDLGR